MPKPKTLRQSQGDTVGTKITVAMSGGVDSSVAAALLLEQGYDVTGIFMKNWSVPINGELVCPWEQDANDARAVAEKLGIPFYVMSFEDEYKKRVVDYMVSEYSRGRTPNPDVMCNSEIKFNLFLEKALSLGADYVATGHYARILFENSGNPKPEIRNPKQKNVILSEAKDLRDSSATPNRLQTSWRLQNDKPTYKLLRGVDSNKDQSYFLYRLGQEQLARLMFPIGEYVKPKVRELARKFNLPTSEKKDSTGVCFIGEFKMLDFLKQEMELKSGAVVDIDTGKRIAEHDGIQYYTIGQRHGFGGGGGTPYYVADKDLKKNILYVAAGHDNPALLSNEIEVEDLHWISRRLSLDKGSLSTKRITAKVRYRGDEYRVQGLSLNKDSEKRTVLVKFHDRAWAATPGQSIVFYDGDICLGGAVIKQKVAASSIETYN